MWRAPETERGSQSGSNGLPPYAVPALLAALSLAVGTTLDGLISHNWVVYTPKEPDDPTFIERVLPSTAYLILAYWLAVPVFKLLGTATKDQIRWYPTWEKQRWMVCTGAIYFVSSVPYIYVSSLGKYDPSIIVPFTMLSVLYLALYDLFRRAVSFQEIAFPIFWVLLGSLFISVQSFSTLFSSFLDSYEVFLWVGLVQQGLLAITQWVQNQTPHDIPPASVGFWRVFWSAVSATVAAIVIGVPTGHIGGLVDVWWHDGFWIAIVVLLARVVFLFASESWTVSARHAGGTPTEVAAVTATRGFWGVPVTLLVWLFCWLAGDPDALGELPRNPMIWGIRFVAGLLIVYGVRELIRRKKAVSTVVKGGS